MYATSFFVAVFCLIVGHSESGSMVLLEGSSKNSSDLVSKVKEANQVEKNRVGEKLLLRKDKDVRGDAWRTERGDLGDLQDLYQTSKDAIPGRDTQNGDKIGVTSYSDPTALYSASNQIVPAYYGTSHRMKRTFWPFTSLFGYDYPPPYSYPPGPGMGGFGGPFGGMGPFGGPFGGMGPFGGGFGMGPFAPPPSLGLGFTFGL